MFLNISLIVFDILLAVSGQFLIKQGMNAIGSFSGVSLINFFSRVIISPYIIAGFVLYFISSFVWFAVLSRVDLSVAYPCLSLGYILVIILGYFFLKEPITVFKVIGSLLICLGVFFIFKK